MKSSGKVSGTVWIPLLYIIGISTYILLNIDRHNDLINLIVAGSFLGITAIFFLCSFVFLNRGKRIAVDLKKAAVKLQNVSGEDVRARIETVKSNQGFFSTKALQKAFSVYCESEMKMETMFPGNNVDISEYINKNVIDKEMKAHFLNQVSGAMTGFGILGTFVGLSIGLDGFNLNVSDVSKLQGEIQPLMEGIKVAFHTSIVGLIYSIGFNIFNRSTLVSYYRALEEYIDAYGTYVVPLNETGSNGPLVNNQKMMITLQKNSLYEQRRICDNVDDISNQIVVEMNNMLKEELVPEIQKMASAFVLSQQNQSQSQIEGVTQIVQLFISEMKSALGDSFSEIGAVLRETSENQKASIEEIRTAISSVSVMATDMSQINDQLKNSIEALSVFSQNMEQTQMNMASVVIGLSEQASLIHNMTQNDFETFDMIRESHSAFVEELNKRAELLEQATERIVGITQTISEKWNSIYETVQEQRANLSQEAVSYMDEMQKQTESVMTAVQEKIKEVQVVSDGFESKMEKASSTLASVTTELGEKMDARTKDTFVIFDKEISAILSKFAATLDKMDKEMRKASFIITDVYANMEKKRQR